MENTRAKALSWWRSLSTNEQMEKSKKHFPEKHFIAITTSSGRIEEMFVKEFNEV